MRKRLISTLLSLSLFTQISACGTLFYPERRGQIDGKIDPAVAAMNTVGLLFFVVPGLIAFAIDFTTGAIYQPGGRYSLAPEKLQPALQADGSVDALRLKAILQHELGHSLPLDHPLLQQHRGSLEHLARYQLTPAA